jgi:glucose-6-phosphate 1-dehydrogenase
MGITAEKGAPPAIEEAAPAVSEKSKSDNPVKEKSVSGGCLSVVVLGASGDLAKKKTFPAIFNLFKQV